MDGVEEDGQEDQEYLRQTLGMVTLEGNISLQGPNGEIGFFPLQPLLEAAKLQQVVSVDGRPQFADAKGNRVSLSFKGRDILVISPNPSVAQDLGSPQQVEDNAGSQEVDDVTTAISGVQQDLPSDHQDLTDTQQNNNDGTNTVAFSSIPPVAQDLGSTQQDEDSTESLENDMTAAISGVQQDLSLDLSGDHQDLSDAPQSDDEATNALPAQASAAENLRHKIIRLVEATEEPEMLQQILTLIEQQAASRLKRKAGPAKGPPGKKQKISAQPTPAPAQPACVPKGRKPVPLEEYLKGSATLPDDAPPPGMRKFRKLKAPDYALMDFKCPYCVKAFDKMASLRKHEVCW